VALPKTNMAHAPFAILFLFLGRAAATQSFNPECTLPPPGTNYVSGPNTRSTLGILWNCLSIIILCTWSIQHLNVPIYRGEAKNIRQKLWWSLRNLWARLKWMILTILAPEFLLGKALDELFVAWPWGRGARFTMVQAYLANMGYFVLDVSDIGPGEQETLACSRSVYRKDREEVRSGRYWEMLFYTPTGYKARQELGGGIKAGDQALSKAYRQYSLPCYYNKAGRYIYSLPAFKVFY